jgi:aldehyde dehydrogenase (NAD+)
VLTDVTAGMTIAREEVFGPVLVVLGYADLDDAVAIANDTDYGLAAYVSGQDLDRARRLAARLRAGQVSINGAYDLAAPFGGYKRSGNGRECGEPAFHEYLETKAVMGYGAAPGRLAPTRPAVGDGAPIQPRAMAVHETAGSSTVSRPPSMRAESLGTRPTRSGSW